MNKFGHILTKKFLIKEYVKNKKSTRKIAKEVGCSYVTISWYLIKFNIPRPMGNWREAFGKRIQINIIGVII